MFKAATLAAAGLLALTASAAVAAPPVPPAPPAPRAPPAPPAPPTPPSMTRHISVGFGFNGEIPASLDWRIEPPGRNAEAPAGSIDFELGYTSLFNSSWWGRTIPVSDLAGLSPAQLSGAGGQVTFVVHRDAGEFRCHGVTTAGKGVGTCVYAANPTFPAALAKRGVAGPLPAIDQFEMALSDLGFNYLDEVKRGGYPTPSATVMLEAFHHGVRLRQLTELNATGYRFGTLEAVIRLRDHGVNARYLTELHGYGFANLKADELVALRDHGVSSGYLKALHEAGYNTAVPVEQLTKMRDHGVSAGFVAEVQQAGYRLSPTDLERLRDHGVTGGFIGELKAMGYDRLTADDIVKLRDHGISTGFIRTSNQGGQRLSTNDLIRLRETGRRP
jgi:hypothetical protein